MTETAVIAGAGPGLGASLARRFAREGCRVALLARTESYIKELATELPDPGTGLAVQTDLTDVGQIRAGFKQIRESFGPVDILVNHASSASWTGLLDSSVSEFEDAWAVNGRGAFVCSQEAVSDMQESGGGTVIFTGATSAVRSRGGAIGFTAAKFAARGMAMDIAQEYGPEGVCVSHVVIDGQIGDTEGQESEQTTLDPDSIADTYWHLVEQSSPDTQPFEVHVTNGVQQTEFI